MNLVKFILIDALACFISISTFFYLYYTYGQSVIAYVKQANIIIFSIAMLGAVCLLTYYKRKPIMLRIKKLQKQINQVEN